MEFFKDILGTVTFDSIEYINLTKNVRIKQFLTNDSLITYTIPDGMTPELVSEKLYGNTRYWWVIMMSANIKDRFYDWPLNNSTLQEYISMLISDGKIIEAQRQNVIDENDSKRIISVLNPKFLNQFLYLIEKKLNQ